MDLLETESPTIFMEGPTKGYDEYYANGGLLELVEYRKAAEIITSGETKPLTDKDVPYNDTALHQALEMVRDPKITITRGEAEAYKYLRNQPPPLKEPTKEELAIRYVQTPPSGLSDQDLLEAVFSMSDPAKQEAFHSYRKDIASLEGRQAAVSKDITRLRHL